MPINAQFDVRFTGEGTLDSPEARGFLQFSRLSWKTYQLNAARLDAVVERGAATLTVSLPRLPATLEAVVQVDAPRTFTAEASFLNARVQELFDPAPPFASGAFTGALTARLTAAGRLDDLAATDADLDLRLVDVSVNGASMVLEHPARLGYAAGQLVADDIDLRIGATTVSASGRLGAPRGGSESLSATLKGSLVDLLPLARLVPSLGEVDASGAVDVQVRAAGPLEAPEIDGEFSLDAAAFTLGMLPPVRDVTLRASYARGLLNLREIRAEWQGATVAASGQVPATLLGDRLPESYRNTLPNLPGRARATARIASVTPAALAPFLGAETISEVAGRLDVVAAVEAGSLALDDVTADVTLDRAELELARVPISQTRPTHLRLADGRLEVVDWAWAGAGNRFTVAGNATLSGKTPRLDFAVAGALDLRMLGAFSRDVVTAGLATLDLEVSGSVNEPAISGQMAIRDGDIVMRDPRVAVTGLEGIVALAGDRLAVRDMSATANGGTVRIEGDLRYSGFEPPGGTITIVGRGLAFEMPEGLRTEVDMDLQFASSQTSRSLTGSVTLQRGSYREPLSLAGQLLAGAELPSVASAEETEPGIADRVSLGVSVVSAQDILVDNNYGRLELGSNLRIIGTLARPVLAGRLTLQEGGEVFLGGRTYRVRRGTVEFTNATRTEPSIDLALETRVQRYDITMQVTGTPETVEAALSSPGASQADIVSLLLTGRLADSDSLAQTEIARGQLLMLLSGEILGFAGRAVGLDTVEISRGLGGAASDFDLLASDTDPGARLTIGKSLRRDVEVVYSQGLQSGDITWIAIYRPLGNFEVRGTTQDDGSRAYEFRHDLDFGGAGGGRLGQAGQAQQQNERVRAVQILGTPGFEVRELRSLLRLGVGDRFDFYRWLQDRESLERFYHDRDYLEARISARRAEVSPQAPEGGVGLEYEVDRGPRTTLVVDGYTLPDAVIEAMKGAWGRAIFDGFLLQDLETMAKEQLVEDGHLQAEVTGDILTQDEGAVKQIALHVVPGTRFDRRRIRFAGQERVATETLEAIVRARPLAIAAWLRPNDLKAAIEQHYHSLGYLAAAVTVDSPVFADRSATLPARIMEGPAFRVGSVVVRGAAAKAEAGVRRVFGIAAGASYRPSLIEPARRAVEVDYLRDGYNNVRVSLTTLIERAQARVDVALEIDEGRQQVLSSVEVVGAERTAGSVIDRALDLEPGGPANLTDYYRAQKRLYDTGVFRSADIELKPVEGATPGPVEPVRAVVTLRELSTYRFRYGLRVNDRVGPSEAGREIRPALVVDLLRRNLFGRAVSTGIAGQLEADRRLARGIMSLPQVFGLPVTTNLFLTASRETFTPEAATPFVEDTADITAEQRFRPANHMAVTYGYSFARTHVFDPDPIPGLPALDLSPKIARLTGTFAWDTRDDPSNARTGWFQSSGFEIGTTSLGSDLRFIKYLAQQHYFREAGRGLVFASAVRLGVGRGFDQDLIPSEKFFAGGATSVRGFAEDGLGEVDFFGDPRGGNGLLLLNQEVRFPIFKWIRGVGFIDGGNVFSRARDLSLTNLEAGAGFGVRVNSPFALVRIDYGMPLTHRAGQPFGRWYFAMGNTF
jgi:outer membrane protein assembly complex protein YaeT